MEGGREGGGERERERERERKGGRDNKYNVIATTLFQRFYSRL